MSCSDEYYKDATRDAFVQLLTAAQTRLFGYITTLLGDVNDASNVLQQTNMVLWRKVDQFEPGTDFHAWALKIAYYQSLAYIRDMKRDRHVFDEELMQQLAIQAMDDPDEDERRLALRHCLGLLGEDQLNLLRQRYLPGKSVGEIAKQRRKSISAIKMALLRMRQVLARCIENQMQVHHEH